MKLQEFAELLERAAENFPRSDCRYSTQEYLRAGTALTDAGFPYMPDWGIIEAVRTLRDGTNPVRFAIIPRLLYGSCVPPERGGTGTAALAA